MFFTACHWTEISYFQTRMQSSLVLLRRPTFYNKFNYSQHKNILPHQDNTDSARAIT